MATVENVNIEINAALKAENERLKEENEAYQKIFVMNEGFEDQLQDDKAELLEALKCIKPLLKQFPTAQEDIDSLLSKHETK